MFQPYSEYSELHLGYLVNEHQQRRPSPSTLLPSFQTKALHLKPFWTIPIILISLVWYWNNVKSIRNVKKIK